MQLPKVNFYVLNTTNKREAELFGCKLIEKFYANGLTIYVQTSSQEESKHFDHLLWTFSDTSFLPHKVDTKASPSVAPIQIGFNDEQPQAQLDVLVNFSQSVPAFYESFKTIIEIVMTESTMQQLARDRYRWYREAGCEIKTYKNNGDTEKHDLNR